MLGLASGVQLCERPQSGENRGAVARFLRGALRPRAGSALATNEGAVVTDRNALSIVDWALVVVPRGAGSGLGAAQANRRAAQPDHRC